MTQYKNSFLFFAHDAAVHRKKDVVQHILVLTHMALSVLILNHNFDISIRTLDISVRLYDQFLMNLQVA